MTDWEYLKSRFYEEVEHRVDALAHGSAENYESYRHQTGVIQGLEIAVEIVETLIARYAEDDDN